MAQSLAPILIFTYKRLDSLQETVAALQNNELASESELFIFSDGPKSENDSEGVKKVREYIKSIKGFKKIVINEALQNRGLANSIINGVSQIIKSSGQVIVLEDDLVVSSNFLEFMNQGLNFYKNNAKVFSIAGYSIPMKTPQGYNYDVYCLPRASSWGWATWEDRWGNIDWRVSTFKEFSNNKKDIKLFNKGGSDMYSMLKKQMDKKIDSWAIRWCYHQFRTQTYTVCPIVSKVKNIGFTSAATNTYVFNRYSTSLDNGKNFKFNFIDEITLERAFLQQFQRFYSVYTRVVSKVKTYLFKAGIKQNK